MQKRRKALFKYREKRDTQRHSRDLLLEAMKMRTKPSKVLDKDAVIPVGGGILEQQMREAVFPLNEEHYFWNRYESEPTGLESREMQCCNKIRLVSNGGVKECHPYVLGSYKKIGSCGGKGFFQHKENPDIFVYHACGAWYVGLEIGSCGGWLMAKSLEMCASSTHLTDWMFYNDGEAELDETFRIVEECQYLGDFQPDHNEQDYNSINQSSNTEPQDQSSKPVQDISAMEPDKVLIDESKSEMKDKDALDTIKHEHIHFHIKFDKEPFFDDDHVPEEGPNGTEAPTKIKEIKAEPDASSYFNGIRIADIPDVEDVNGNGDMKRSNYENRRSPNLVIGFPEKFEKLKKDEANSRTVLDQPEDQNDDEEDIQTKNPFRQGQRIPIFINNFHAMPATVTTTTVLTTTSTTTSTTASTTTTSTTTTSTTVRVPTTAKSFPYTAFQSPEYFHGLRIPLSDLQYEAPPSSLAQHLNKDIFESTQYFVQGDQDFFSQDSGDESESHLVGFIIKRKKRPKIGYHPKEDEETTKKPLEVQSQMETRDMSGGDSMVELFSDQGNDNFYFPIKGFRGAEENPEEKSKSRLIDS